MEILPVSWAVQFALSEPGTWRDLSTAERNVEMCSAGGGIALGRHYKWCSMEENGRKCDEKITEMLFSRWMPMRAFFGQELPFRRAPALSRLLHMRNLPPTIIITRVSYLPQEGTWFYLGSFSLLLVFTTNHCFAWYECGILKDN